MFSHNFVSTVQSTLKLTKITYCIIIYHLIISPLQVTQLIPQGMLAARASASYSVAWEGWTSASYSVAGPLPTIQ